jgi:hypothetical protein
MRAVLLESILESSTLQPALSTDVAYNSAVASSGVDLPTKGAWKMELRTTRLLLLAAIVQAGMVLSLSACSSNSNKGAASTESYTLIYFDGHMHTVRSDGTGSVAQAKATAQSRGLSAVIITDHCHGGELTQAKWESLIADTTAASDASFLALPGFEMTGDEGMLNRDHIIAWDVSTPFVDNAETCPEEAWPSPANPEGYGTTAPENLAKWVDFVHSQGGIAVHAHPIGTTRLEYGVDGIEAYNVAQMTDLVRYAELAGYSDTEAADLALFLSNMNIYGGRDIEQPVRLPNSTQMMPAREALAKIAGLKLGGSEAPLLSWDDLLKAYLDRQIDHPTFAYADTDSHNTGDADSNVGLAKNGLLVKELTPDEVYSAIRAGRSFATTGPSLDFTVNGVVMGETAKLKKTAAVEVSADSESNSAVIEKIDIIKNGEVVETLNPNTNMGGETFQDDVSGTGYYRVEVTSYDSGSGKRYYAWSNPVFFDAS